MPVLQYAFRAYARKAFEGNPVPPPPITRPEARRTVRLGVDAIAAAHAVVERERWEQRVERTGRRPLLTTQPREVLSYAAD